ncbi:tetratricopeptide repeat protein [Nocardia jejuensis]|uniref:tetratricopeptide repeat protein n=1 Tax=Nocardia jejuensis TaxID=328049 RepID=UPI000835DDDA|nr:tetratricopeptide repeat protein [Nocardia jejuensis]
MNDRIAKAWVLADLGRLERARELLAEVLAGDPDNPLALVHLADVALRLGENDRALEHTSAALRVSPEFTAAWRVRAVALVRSSRAPHHDRPDRHRRMADAESAARRALELDTEDTDSLRVLATVLQYSDPEAAVRYLDHALEVAPDGVRLHVLRGAVLRRMKNHDPRYTELAEAAFREALRLDPSNAEAVYRLARIERGRGNFDTAAELFRRTALLDPEYADEARRNLAALTHLRVPNQPAE